MIVRFPDGPNVDGPLVLPRPAVFLLGSYDPVTGAHGAWYEEAARYLEQYVGSVFYGVVVGQFREEFIRWFFYWLDRCDIGVVWLDRGHPGSTWSQFEVGYLFGSYARTGEPKMFVGLSPGQDSLKISLELVNDHLGLQLKIYEDLAAMLHAVRAEARGLR